MLWQQALLFPQHITKLGCLRLDDPNNLQVEVVSHQVPRTFVHSNHTKRRRQCSNIFRSARPGPVFVAQVTNRRNTA